MSNANLDNIIALAGIILVIPLCVWLNQQTRKVTPDIERLTRKNTRHRYPLRASRWR